MDEGYQSRDQWLDEKIGVRGVQSKIAIGNHNIADIPPRRVCLFSNNSKTGLSNIYFWADSQLTPCNYRGSPHRPLNPVVFNHRYSNRYLYPDSRFIAIQNRNFEFVNAMNNYNQSQLSLLITLYTRENIWYSYQHLVASTEDLLKILSLLGIF